VRVPRCELRDRINCRKNDRWPSYRFYRALQRLKSSIRCICEIFGAARFSSFSTQSVKNGPDALEMGCRTTPETRHRSAIRDALLSLLTDARCRKSG